ncbi:MAG: DUF5018 domain-containing protein [Bacteroidales bacterium]
MKKNLRNLLSIALFGGALGSPLFAQTVLDVTEITTVNLTKADIASNDYLSYSKDAWQTAKTYCEVEGDFVNLSSTDRIITLTAQNVESAYVTVYSSNAGRVFDIQINDDEVSTITHPGGGCFIESVITNTNGIVAIKIKGGGSSVYPVSITLNPAGDVIEESDIATLSAITVDGVQISGFNADQKSYDVEVPFSIESIPVVEATVTHPKATYVVEQATSLPGVATIEVTAEKGNKEVYTVNLTKAQASSECGIISFIIPNQRGESVIDHEAGTIFASLLVGSDLTSITPAIRISSYATIDKSGAQDFSTPVTYVVTAEDGSTKSYTVTVELTEQQYLSELPYSSDLPSDFTMPGWLSSKNGSLSFNAAYTGADKEALESGDDVLRIGQNDEMMLYLSKCGTVTVTMSATGGRTFKLLVDGVEKQSVVGVKNVKYTLSHEVETTEPVVISLVNEGTGGATIGSIQVSSPIETSIEDVKGGALIYVDGVVINPEGVSVDIFNIGGNKIATSNSNIDLKSYPAGVYIVRTETKTMKVVR